MWSKSDNPLPAVVGIFDIICGADYFETILLPGAPSTMIGDTRSNRILVVDDDACGLGLMKLFLQTQGFEVSTAVNISEAVRAAEDHSIGAIVSDLSLKDESGLDLMREIRKRSVVPAIALSGYSGPEDRQESREAGFIEHLSKPVDFDVLLETLRRVLPGNETSQTQ